MTEPEHILQKLILEQNRQCCKCLCYGEGVVGCIVVDLLIAGNVGQSVAGFSDDILAIK